MPPPLELPPPVPPDDPPPPFPPPLMPPPPIPLPTEPLGFGMMLKDFTPLFEDALSLDDPTEELFAGSEVEALDFDRDRRLAVPVAGSLDVEERDVDDRDFEESLVAELPADDRESAGSTLAI